MHRLVSDQLIEKNSKKYTGLYTSVKSFTLYPEELRLNSVSYIIYLVVRLVGCLIRRFFYR